MKPYKNLSGNSKVKSFQIYGDAIKIQLNDGSTYLYLYEKSGFKTVDKMKQLATEGKGLGTFIGTYGTATAEKIEGS